MNIILDNIIFDLQKAGGISKFWAKHIEFISTQKFQCTLIESYDSSINNIFRQEVSVPSQIDRIYNQRKFIPLTRYFPVNFDSQNDAVFHSSYFRNPIDRRMLTVHTVHDFMYEKFEYGIKKFLHVTQKKSAMKRADVIVCVSEKTKLDMYELYPWTQDKKVEVIYNGVDDEFFPIKNKEHTIKIGKLELIDKNYLLYVGARGYCKNFPFAVSLMDTEFVRDHDLKLVCVGGGHFSEYEKQMLIDAGVDKKIIKLDGISSHSLNLLYNSARALIIPSIYEGFGIPALEAAKTGCIVLGANNSSIPEIVGDSSFLFSPFEFNQAIKCLEKLDDINLVNESRKNAIEYSKMFSWSKMSHEYINIYNGLLKS